MRFFFSLPLILLVVLSLSKLESIAVESGAQEEWMGIYSGNDKIGYSQTLIKSDGIKTEAFEENRLRMKALGTEQDINMKSSYVLNGYKLESFQFSMNAGSVVLNATGVRQGNQIKIKTQSVSGETEIPFPLKEDALISTVLYKWLMEQKPKVGKSYTVDVFDPSVALTGAGTESLKTVVIVEAEEPIIIPYGSFKTYRVKTTFTGSEITSWLDQDGNVIKQISPPGLTAFKEAKATALNDDFQSLDIVAKTAISSDVPLNNSRELRLLRLQVKGIDSIEGLDLDDNYRQFYKNGILEIRVADISHLNNYSIPYNKDEYSRYIKPTSLIQSRDKEIVNMANEIIGGERDSLKVVKEINNWVYENIEKEATVSFPNALDVLKTKRGDCTEHAALFAALSRAVGIPTKIVLGVVFINGGFYYHAWNEIFSDKWIAVDPTFGQVPADASHIKFIEGDFSKSSEITKLMGKVKFEIKEAI